MKSGDRVNAARLACLIVLFATGCDRLDAMKVAGWEKVTLASQPFELDSAGRTFASRGQMRALGFSAACVVLKTRYPLTPRKRMDRDFDSLLQGAKLSATLTAVNGQQFPLYFVGQAWAAEGSVSSSAEMSACMSADGVPEVPVGTVIKSVHIKSDKAIRVLGAYWESMPDHRQHAAGEVRSPCVRGAAPPDLQRVDAGQCPKEPI